MIKLYGIHGEILHGVFVGGVADLDLNEFIGRYNSTYCDDVDFSSGVFEGGKTVVGNKYTPRTVRLNLFQNSNNVSLVSSYSLCPMAARNFVFEAADVLKLKQIDLDRGSISLAVMQTAGVERLVRESCTSGISDWSLAKFFRERK